VLILSRHYSAINKDKPPPRPDDTTSQARKNLLIPTTITVIYYMNLWYGRGILEIWAKFGKKQGSAAA
jgi:hypothetical protein